MTAKSFLKSSAVLFIGTMIANAGAYFFHLALGRILSPAEYSTLGALLSIYLILATPLGAVENTAAKIISQKTDTPEILSTKIRQTNQYLGKISLVSLIVYFLLIGFIYHYFNFENYTGLVILGLGLLFMFKLSWNRGVMQGLFDFNWLSLSFASEGLVKLIVGLILGWIFLRADITISSLVLALLVSFLLSRYYLQRKFPSVSEGKKVVLNYSQLLKESLRMIIGILGVSFFLSIDVLMAKKYLPAHDAGLYTALSTLGKIIYFAPLSIATALFPYISQTNTQSQRLNLLKKALLMVCAVVVIALIFYFTCPNLIFTILFGQKYSFDYILLGYMGLALGVVGIVQLLINYLLAHRGWWYMFALAISAIIQFFAYTIFHQNINQIVYVTLACSCIMLFLVSCSLFRTEKI